MTTTKTTLTPAQNKVLVSLQQNTQVKSKYNPATLKALQTKKFITVNSKTNMVKLTAAGRKLLTAAAKSKPVEKAPAVKKPVVKKAAPKKAVTKKAPVKKAPVKKAVTKKAPAKGKKSYNRQMTSLRNKVLKALEAVENNSSGLTTQKEYDKAFIQYFL